MPQRFENVTGFVLAGGESRRMGRPKPSLVLDGQTMLERQVRLLARVCRTTAVTGMRGARHSSEALALADIFPGRGPLSGIYTGLVHSRTDYNLFISCDLPFLDALFLEYLCRRALDSAADATVPRTGGFRFQPLCAVYRRRIRWIIRAALDSDRGKISDIFPKLHCEILDAGELVRKRFPAAIFANMNTPADYEAARRRLEAGSRF